MIVVRTSLNGLTIRPGFVDSFELENVLFNNSAISFIGRFSKPIKSDKEESSFASTIDLTAEMFFFLVHQN